MGSIIIAVTTLFKTVLSKITGGLLFVVSAIAKGIAAIGRKLLSFEWVKRVCEFFKKIYNFLKKTVFNPVVLKIVNITLSLGLFALAVAQTVFVVIDLVAARSVVSGGQASPIVFYALNALAALICIAYLLSFVVGLFKKTFKYGFVGALVLVHIVLLLSQNLMGDPLYGGIAQKINGLKIAAIVVFAVLALFKLADGDKPTSFIAVLFCIFSAVLVAVLYQSCGFGGAAEYYFGNEMQIKAADLDIILYLRYLKQFVLGTVAAGNTTAAVLAQSVGLAETSGKFTASFVAAGNGLVCFVCSVAPYVLLTTLMGYLVGMLNNRVTQTVYLTRVLKTLKYLFLCELLTAIVALVIKSAFSNELIILALNAGNMILSLLFTVALAGICALSRWLISEKLARKFDF